MGLLRTVLHIALRNLFARRVNLLVGLLIAGGTFLLIVGGTLLRNMDAAMHRSVAGSLAGDLQLYATRSKDAVSLFGGMGGEAELARIEDYARVQKTLSASPSVESMVPMGIHGTLFTPGNTLDLLLARLRSLAREKAEGTGGADWAERWERSKAHVRFSVGRLKDSTRRSQDISLARTVSEDVAVLEQADSDAFWAGFDAAPEQGLEFLDNKVAPIAADGLIADVRYLGTDVGRFARTFRSMRIVDGQGIPEGARGFLFAKYYYEEHLKLQTARRLDKLEDALKSGGKIADSPELQGWVRQNKEETRELLLQLDGPATRVLTEALRKELGSSARELPALLSAFFDTNDANFQRRYDFFYRSIAPHLQLYLVPLGETLALKAVGRSGFATSVSVKVYGTFEFEGLSKSSLVGNLNLMDLVSFGELYGFTSPEEAAELETLREGVAAVPLSREEAERQLFASTETPEAPGMTADIDRAEQLEGKSRRAFEQVQQARRYTAADYDQGVVLNAAVKLKPGVSSDVALRELQALSDKEKLGVTLVDWREASGLMGQLTAVATGLLFAAVSILFLVVAIIISNAVTLAVLRRMREFGTVRALGAQKGFVLALVWVETALVGLSGALLGALGGGALLVYLGKVGVPAAGDALYLFFGGPRLYPTVSLPFVTLTVGIIVVLSILAGTFPALLAGRVSPVRAMQAED